MVAAPVTDLVSAHADEDEFAISESLVPAREIKAQGITRVGLDGILKDQLRLKEDLKKGCGGQLWPAGIALAKYMLRNHASDLHGKTIVELGAGGGLVGLAVAQACRIDSDMFITDQEPMLPLMRENIDLNGLSSKVKALVLDWGSPLPDAIPDNPEVILAADCVYFEPSFPLLRSTLQDLLGPESVCYFCFKRRRRADMRFLKEARKIFDVVEIRGVEDEEMYRRENIFLYTIRQRTTGGKM
ncbi:hypothetical protein FQN54_002221 [Arachnomyces sp. PD_36]|nr:hypothetical protein FQN54_002221 [Arachnomyces sp. PD_36]